MPFKVADLMVDILPGAQAAPQVQAPICPFAGAITQCGACSDGCTRCTDGCTRCTDGCTICSQGCTVCSQGCSHCTQCTGCTHCTGCTQCTGCTGCTGCTQCSACSGGCTACTGGCTRCSNGCTVCSDGCTRCTDFATRCTIHTNCLHISILPQATGQVVPADLMTLKAELQHALAQVDAQQQAVEESLRPQTVEQVDELEQKLRAALDELQTRRNELQGRSEEGQQQA